MGDIVSDLRREIGAAHAKIQNQNNYLRQMGGESALMRQQLTLVDQNMQQLAGMLQGISGGGAREPQLGSVQSRDQILFIDQIPGRRIPFDMLLSIPIGANVTSAQQQTMTISQDGPFVATARFAVFQSSHQFSQLVNGARVSFQGRTNGRFRPIHSVCDWLDGAAFQPVVGAANPGVGGPIYASPSNHAGSRSMEFDGVVELINQGSGYPRHNTPVPTAFWAAEQNSAFQLAALDFFERGEVIQIKVTPTHINNPMGGNVAQFLAGGVFPGLDSQYDVHEGILDEYSAQATTDPAQRVPQGILIIGLHGFKIIQPPGPVALV
jgi:hypothetical protein